MICEREDEIEASSRGNTGPRGGMSTEQRFPPHTGRIQGKKVEQFSFTDAAQAHEDERTLDAGRRAASCRCRSWSASSANAIRPRPSRPLRCSRSRTQLGFSAQRTMRVAQQLYEGVDIGEGAVGLITYMRTDSVNLAGEAYRDSRRDRAALRAGRTSEEPRIYQTKAKNAQEAHEAIRPTSAAVIPADIER